jgi:hypothetical protein
MNNSNCTLDYQDSFYLPEANFFPLKAEGFEFLAPQRGLIATKFCQIRQRLRPRARARLYKILGKGRETHSRNCQTFAALPAEPVDLPTD